MLADAIGVVSTSVTSAGILSFTSVKSKGVTESRSGAKSFEISFPNISGLDERPYFGDYNGYIYRMDTGTDDYPLGVKTAIDAYYYTNWKYFDDCPIEMRNEYLLHNKLPEKYDYNHNFFENIDTEDKAYFLGLMYADGNNYIRAKHSYEVSIKLQDSIVKKTEIENDMKNNKYIVKIQKMNDRIEEIKKELELSSNQVDKFIQNYEKIIFNGKRLNIKYV